MQQATQQEYVDGMGANCPYCRSTDLNHGSFDIGPGSIGVSVTCAECEKTWEENYSLTAYTPS